MMLWNPLPMKVMFPMKIFLHSCLCILKVCYHSKQKEDGVIMSQSQNPFVSDINLTGNRS